MSDEMADVLRSLGVSLAALLCILRLCIVNHSLELDGEVQSRLRVDKALTALIPVCINAKHSLYYVLVPRDYQCGHHSYSFYSQMLYLLSV